MKSVISQIKARPRSRTNKFGVSSIVREGYGSASAWYRTVDEVRKRDGYCCIVCKRTEAELKKLGLRLETHHFNRLSRGGTTTKANLGSLCSDCHGRRHSHLK